MVECPRCDGQGFVYLGEVLNKKMLICDECDACWDERMEIRKDNFRDLTTYLKSMNTTDKVQFVHYI